VGAVGDGLALGVHGVLKNFGLTPKSVIVNRVITFLYVVAAFVIFRSPNLHTAREMLSRMVGAGGIESWSDLKVFVPGSFAVLLVGCLVFVQFAPNTWELKLKPRLIYGVATGVAAAVAIMSIAVPPPFLYFQF